MMQIPIGKGDIATTNKIIIQIIADGVVSMEVETKGAPMAINMMLTGLADLIKRVTKENKINELTEELCIELKKRVL